MSESHERQPRVETGKLTVELGCVGCEHAVEFGTSAPIESVLKNTVPGTPHYIHDDKAGWRQGGGDACIAARQSGDGCPNQANIEASRDNILRDA